MICTIENEGDFTLGTKAKNLFLLSKHGICVPPFFCVSEDDAPGASAFAASYLCDCNCVSVRSCANAEDGKNTSFAGQFHTELNVPMNKINAAVKKVCTIPSGKGFHEYCRQNNIHSEKIHLHAIVQQMIEADYSGVIFTANPQGILNETVIVVGSGTGDNVVEDRTDTTTYFYNRTDHMYYQETSGPSSPHISETLLHTLLKLSGKIRHILSDRHEYDIEFAIKQNEIFILQARPITTLCATEPTIVLDNSNIVESYPGITLPLTQSFIREAYYRVFHSVLLRLTREPKTVAKMEDSLHHMVDTANGRVYYRISNWYDILLFLPFHKKIIPIWQEMLGVKNKTVTTHTENHIRLFTRAKVAVSFIRLLFTCPGHMKKLDRYFEEILSQFKRVNLDTADNETILAHYQSLLKKVAEQWDLTLVNDMYTFLFTGLLKARLKAKKIPDFDAAATRYISGIGGMESMKPVQTLIELAASAEKQGELSQLKVIKNVGDYKKYEKTGSMTAKKIAEYIEQYGDRNMEELKLESKTFRTNPELLTEKIVQYAEDEIAVTASGERNKKTLHGLCGVFARRAAVGIRNREKSRLNRSRLYGMMRTMMLKTGENLVKTGSITKAGDIFYLTYDELENLVKQHRDVQTIIDQRIDLYHRFEKLPAYSRIVFSQKVFDKIPKHIAGMEPVPDASVLEGTACSGGTAEGEVLVITHITQNLDTAGKILVTKMTDPGWVFLLAGASGIIAEKGSLLSHTAIISRELGKPAVVGVNHATSVLKTGDFVKIDGDTGRIVRLSRNKSNTTKSDFHAETGV